MNRRSFILAGLGCLLGLFACAAPQACPPEPLDTDLDDLEDGPELAEGTLFNIDASTYELWRATSYDPTPLTMEKILRATNDLRQKY